MLRKGRAQGHGEKQGIISKDGVKPSKQNIDRVSRGKIVTLRPLKP